MATLGIDFGTSNTSAAVMTPDGPRLIAVEPGQTSLPTSVFFDPDSRETLVGSAANAALISGREGRFMRALKSVLGTPLMQERRVVAHERLTLIEVVARFLVILKQRAEAETGQVFDSVLSGRPVRFHSTDMDRNARAEDDLRAAYGLAGFAHVNFLFEPEAAARTAAPLGAQDFGLIVDIGGGTSDFTVFAPGGVVASHGVRIGGTDFDRRLNITHVMPHLGRGALVRNEMGQGTHTAPSGLFNDLATWEKIPFLYTPDTLRLAKRYARLGVDPLLFERLVSVLETETGHDLAFAVEDAKIAANSADGAAIDLGIVDPGLVAPLSQAALTDALAPFAADIAAAAAQTIEQAGLDRAQITQIVFVGGSSLMGAVVGALTDLLPHAAQSRASAFTAVAEGLAIAAAPS